MRGASNEELLANPHGPGAWVRVGSSWFPSPFYSTGRESFLEEFPRNIYDRSYKAYEISLEVVDEARYVSHWGTYLGQTWEIRTLYDVAESWVSDDARKALERPLYETFPLIYFPVDLDDQNVYTYAWLDTEEFLGMSVYEEISAQVPGSTTWSPREYQGFWIDGNIPLREFKNLEQRIEWSYARSD